MLPDINNLIALVKGGNTLLFYYDETGLYYLRSRYYDPVTGRFLNADVYADTGSGLPLSTNMFAYCENNQLYKVDCNGRDAAWIQAPDSVNILSYKMGHS